MLSKMGSLFNGHFQALGFNIGAVHKIRHKGQHFWLFWKFILVYNALYFQQF